MHGWREALARTRAVVRSWVVRPDRGGRGRDEILRELEMSLVQADVPAPLAMAWIEDVRREPSTERATIARIRELALDSFRSLPAFHWHCPPRPRVILLIGVNGSGKTTTAAKLAHRVLREGGAPLLAATDTFRAAGAEQLRIWAERVGCDIVAGQPHDDASAVAFDAVSAAVARQRDVVCIDTAGRMHTKQPLLEELHKLCRAAGKAMPGAPHETWLVLDATLGHNAVVQAAAFKNRIGVTGAVISKLDGSSKGGFLLAVERELGIPIRFAGVGEGMDDLVPFDPVAFVTALLEPASGPVPGVDDHAPSCENRPNHG